MKITITGNKITDEWPKTPRGLCHWCCHPFSNVPVLLPHWTGTRYHLSGNYCSFDCAKSDAILKSRAGQFPKSLTALALFAAKLHPPFAGITPAPPKETLQAFGGSATITEFRRHSMTIRSYASVQRIWKPRELMNGTKINPRYLYTLEPLRRTQLIESEEEDPVALIQRRVW